MPDTTNGRAAEIARLNDLLRHSFSGGRVVITAGIQALGPQHIAAIMDAVRAFNVFTPDNDPHGEHDCGLLTVGDIRLMWKIDYYDKAMTYMSPDPANPAVTNRILTVLLAEEY